MRRFWGNCLLGLILLSSGAALGGWLTHIRCAPWMAAWALAGFAPPAPPADEQAGHDHAHEEEGERKSLVISPQARDNLKLRTAKVKLSEFWRRVSVPGEVAERPGHSHRRVTVPVSGIIRDVYVHPNQLIRPGDLLLELDLTGEAMATAQTALLRTLGELELNQRELERITPLAKSGGVSEKTRLELTYDRKRLEVQSGAQQQALEILGLSLSQIQEMTKTGKLLRRFTVRAPDFSTEEKGHAAEGFSQSLSRESLPLKSLPALVPSASGTALPTTSPTLDWSYTVEKLEVFPGKHVEIGDEVLGLAFHAVLYLVGEAFERESELLGRAMIEGWPVAARFDVGTDPQLVRDDLRILFLENVIEPNTQTVHFTLALSNEVYYDRRNEQGEIYRSWRFKPGQKAELLVPVEHQRDKIVLPAGAVVREGPEAFVFLVNGKKLERQRVRVEYQAREEVVLTNDGSIFPGEQIVLNQAYALNLALKQAAETGSGHGHDHHGHSH